MAPFGAVLSAGKWNGALWEGIALVERRGRHYGGDNAKQWGDDSGMASDFQLRPLKLSTQQDKCID